MIPSDLVRYERLEMPSKIARPSIIRTEATPLSRKVLLLRKFINIAGCYFCKNDKKCKMRDYCYC